MRNEGDAHAAIARREIVAKTIVTHTITYFVAGIVAFTVFDYPRLIAGTTIGASMRPLDHPMVVGGALFQPVRGLLFGAVFCVFRQAFFERRHGWLLIWMLLVSFGILGTFGAPPGSLEGFIYSNVPARVQLMFLPEVVLQSLALSWLVFEWVNHRGNRWFGWAMGAAFVLALLLPALGLAAALRG